MKKYFKIFVSIIMAILSLGILGYFFLIKPIMEEEKSLKPVLLVAVNQLLNCSFETKEIETCYRQKTSKAFQKAMSLNQFVSLSNIVKNKLGKRLNSELVDEKFNLTVFKGTNSGKRVNFIVNAAYQNDIFATESYVYSFDQVSNEYKLDSIIFNSNKLIE